MSGGAVVQTAPRTRSIAQKIALFRACFTGLPHAYGTFDPHDGRIYQVKQPVTDQVLLRHIEGHRPYGVYLLVGDQTRALAVDFDTLDLFPAIEFVRQAQHYEIPAYIERSKSKGYHVWVFFEDPGVPARKARTVARHILMEIDQPRTEIFPKQDSLDTQVRHGSFIFAPLFGAMLPEGRTVFVRTDYPSKPHPDQWAFLERVRRVSAQHLDEIIELNGIEYATVHAATVVPEGAEHNVTSTCGLPICAQRMLAHGVRNNQRVSCFRLAVALKRTGLPVDMALAVLRTWACRNRPANGKRIITPLEIESQTHDAYNRKYRSFGCEDAVVQPFCDPQCRVRSHVVTPLDDPADARGRDPIEPPTRSTTMSTSPANRPIKEFRARNLSLAIWQNEGTTRDGRPIKLHSITLNKRYQDQQTREWKDSSSFFPDDLPRLRLLLDKAYEHILLPEGDADHAGNGPDTPAA